MNSHKSERSNVKHTEYFLRQPMVQENAVEGGTRRNQILDRKDLAN